MAQTSFWKVAVACLIVQIGFGCYPVLVKAFDDDKKFNMVVFSFYRDILCAPFLLVTAWWLEGNHGKLQQGDQTWKRTLKVPSAKHELLTFLMLGFVGIGGQQLCFIMGSYYTTPVIASIFQNTIPVWATFFSIALKQESPPNPKTRLGLTKVIGFLFAIIGGVIMNLYKSNNNNNDDDDTEENMGLGMLFLVSNTGLSGLYLVLQKITIFNSKTNATWKTLPVHVTAWAYVFGSIFAGFVTAFGHIFHMKILEFEQGSETDSFRLPLQAFIPLIYALVVSSALCYGLLSFANQNAPSSVVSSFWPFQVPVAILLSYAVGLGSVSKFQVVGGLLIVFGLLLVCTAAYYEEKATIRTEDNNEEEVLVEEDVPFLH